MKDTNHIVKEDMLKLVIKFSVPRVLVSKKKGRSLLLPAPIPMAA